MTSLAQGNYLKYMAAERARTAHKAVRAKFMELCIYLTMYRSSKPSGKR